MEKIKTENWQKIISIGSKVVYNDIDQTVVEIIKDNNNGYGNMVLISPRMEYVNIAEITIK